MRPFIILTIFADAYGIESVPLEIKLVSASAITVGAVIEDNFLLGDIL
jgi:hypothetical protein